MAKDGPLPTTALAYWRGAALAACLVAAGCSEGPPEGPFAATQPIPRPAVDLRLCEHADPAPTAAAAPVLAPLPAPDAPPTPHDDPSQPQPLPPAELTLDAYTEWLADSPADASSPPPGSRRLESLARSLLEDEEPGSPAPPPPLAQELTARAATPGAVAIPPTGGAPVAGEPAGPVADGAHNAEARELLAEATAAATGLPTSDVVTDRAKAKIRQGYTLAQRGANFAARSEFLQVLRLIAEAQDQEHGARRRTVALANGLRALEEAADFAPRDAEPDADPDLAVIVSAHRTPVAKSIDCQALLPQQLADRYFRYAQVQLGAAVAGEPAGSMALHALGKLYSQLDRTEPDNAPLADRRAFALQQAALLARPDNHLAAHELGVLLAESGHYGEAEFLLAQVAAREPHAVVLRNLARVQRKRGNEPAALASDEQAQRLANLEGAAHSPVVWVAPDALARTGDPLGPAAPPQVAGRGQLSPTGPGTTAAAPANPPAIKNVTRLPGGLLR